MPLMLNWTYMHKHGHHFIIAAEADRLDEVMPVLERWQSESWCPLSEDDLAAFREGWLQIGVES